MTVMTQILYNILLFMDWNYASNKKNLVAHMFYPWSFSNNKAVPIAIKQNKKILNIYTTLFVWGSSHSDKI